MQVCVRVYGCVVSALTCGEHSLEELSKDSTGSLVWNTVSSSDPTLMSSPCMITGGVLEGVEGEGLVIGVVTRT